MRVGWFCAVRCDLELNRSLSFDRYRPNMIRPSVTSNQAQKHAERKPGSGIKGCLGGDLLPYAVGGGEQKGCVGSVDGWAAEDRVAEIVRGGGLDELQVEIVNLTEILNLLSLVTLY